MATIANELKYVHILTQGEANLKFRSSTKENIRKRGKAKYPASPKGLKKSDEYKS